MKHFIAALAISLVVATAANAQLINGSVIVDEINYHNDSTTSSGDWFELYNTVATTVDLGGWTVRDNTQTNQFVLPLGTTLGGHQYLVVVNNAAAFASRFPSVTNYVGAFSYNLGNTSDQIRLFNADDVLQYSVTYFGDTLGWPKGAHGYGRTLELTTVDADPNSASSWFDGCMFGSPGTAYQPCNPSLVFSEINYRSDTAHNSGDWVELHNTTNASINITGWRLRDSQDSLQFVFPTVTLPANAYLVAYQNLALFNAVHPNVTNKVGPLPFGFSSKGEVIRLYNAQNKLQFSVVYDNKLPWDTTADGHGYTLNLIDAHGHMDDGHNWKTDCFLGSPGTAGCVNDLSPRRLNGVSVFPTADYSAYTVETGTNGMRFEMCDIQGRTVNKGMLRNGPNTLDMQAFASGVYILKVNDGAASAAFKLLR